MAKVHYEADGPIPAERFIAALTDFGERRPELWPNLDAKYYQLHELGDTWAEVTEGTDVLGGVWARERYDWSEPGLVRLRLVDAMDFRPGTDDRLPRDAAGRRRLPRRGRLPADRRQPPRPDRRRGGPARRSPSVRRRPPRDARSPAGTAT